MLTAALPPLPPGFTPAAAPSQPAAPRVAPATRRPYPPVSGVLTEVTTACDAVATVHRAGYDVISPRGGYTVHGYAWRCTRCGHLTVGYLPQDGFRRALHDASQHRCEAHRG